MNKLIATKFSITGPGIVPDGDGISTLDNIISFIIGFLSIILIIWFAIRIILATYNYISAEGDKNKLQAARKSITDGILGMAIGLLAIFLVALLAQLLGVPNAFDLPQQINNIINF